MSENITPPSFPGWVKPLIEGHEQIFVCKSEDYLTRYYRFQAAINIPKYGWRTTPLEVYEEKLRCVQSPGELNMLFWQDFARNLEAYYVTVNWRALELCESIYRTLATHSISSAAVLSRSLLELAAAFVVNACSILATVKDLVPHLKQGGTVVASAELELLLNRALFGSRLPDTDEDLKQTNILTIFDKLAKVEACGEIKGLYERLCEIAHPNLMGNSRFWSEMVEPRPDGCAIMTIYRRPKSGGFVTKIVTDLLWATSWSTRSVENCIMLLAVPMKEILTLFPPID